MTEDDVEGWKFAIGDFVRKHSGAWWEGRVVGTYSTSQTPRGYSVQLQVPGGKGPVQLYPEAALESAPLPPALDMEKVEKALEVFDDALGEDDDGYADSLMITMKWGAHTDYSVCVGNLRAIRSVLSEIRKARGKE